MTFRTSTFRCGGHDLVYDDYGDPGTDRVLVYIHGLLIDSEINRGIARALSDQGHRVVLLDLLGHGRSDKPTHASEYRIDTYTEQVVALLDELELAAAVLGGMSLGANVSLFTASRRPGPGAGSRARDARARVGGPVGRPALRSDDAARALRQAPRGPPVLPRRPRSGHPHRGGQQPPARGVAAARQHGRAAARHPRRARGPHRRGAPRHRGADADPRPTATTSSIRSTTPPTWRSSSRTPGWSGPGRPSNCVCAPTASPT